MNQLLPHWNKVMPQFDPRISQLETFKWLEELPDNVKYILLEMPVGGGKSPVGLTYSSYLSKSGYGSSFVLTPQKILQKQYEDSFDNTLLASMYGKANYECKGKNADCELGSMIKPVCTNCPYQIAKELSKLSPNMVLNYKLALLYFAHMPDLKPRKLIVFDECHNLENHLIDFSEVSISQKKCGQMKTIDLYIPDDIYDAYKWIQDQYMPHLFSFVNSLNNEVQRIESGGEKLTGEDKQILKDHMRYTRHLRGIEKILEFGLGGEDISEYLVLVKNYDRFTIKELYGGRVFHTLVKPFAEKFLFMSSTILNKEGFCRDLRIKPDEAAFLSLSSEFTKEQRPVIYFPRCKMNYGWDDDKPARINGRKLMLESVKDILMNHDGESGIIHTGSFKVAQWLVEELRLGGGVPHEILHHNPEGNKQLVKRDEVIGQYMEQASIVPTILISPSITEGLDLKDDLGRFTIFVKVPYPSLADEWIKRRMQISDDWYKRQALKSMIQGSGRICRHHEDYGVTYILDQSFGFLYDRTKNKSIPQWWEEGMEFF